MPITVLEDSDQRRTWQLFMMSLLREPYNLPKDHVKAAAQHWRKLCGHFGAELSPPLTLVTGEGAIQFAWDTGAQYFDVEVFPDGKLAWFFRDRATRNTDGTEDELVDELPKAALDRLAGIVAAVSVESQLPRDASIA